MRAIIERDLLHELCRRSFFRTRTFVAGAGAAAIVVAAALAGSTDPDRVGAVFLSVAGHAALLVLLAVIPASAAAGIVRDRISGSLDVLRTTPLSGPGIVGATWIASLAHGLLLTVLTFPFVALATTFGGLLPEHVLAVAAVLAGAAAMATALTLAAGWCVGDPTAVSKVAYGALLALVALGPVLAGTPAAGGALGDLPQRLAALAALASPWSRLAAILAGVDAGAGGMPPWLGGYGLAVLAVTGAALTLASVAIRGGRSRATLRRGDAAGRRRRLFRRLLETRPLVWLGIRRHLRVRPGWMLLVGGIVVALLELRFARLLGGAAGPVALLEPVLSFAGVVLAMAAVSGALALQRELRKNTMDVLHASPASNEHLVQGVYVGCVAPLAPLLALAVVHGAIAAAAGGTGPWWVVVFAVALGTSAAILAARAMAAGASARTPARALAASGAQIGLWMLGSFLTLLLPTCMAGAIAAGLGSWGPVLFVWCLYAETYPFAVAFAAAELGGLHPLLAVVALLPMFLHAGQLRTFLKDEIPRAYLGKPRRGEGYRQVLRRQRQGRPAPGTFSAAEAAQRREDALARSGARRR